MGCGQSGVYPSCLVARGPTPRANYSAKLFNLLGATATDLAAMRWRAGAPAQQLARASPGRLRCAIRLDAPQTRSCAAEPLIYVNLGMYITMEPQEEADAARTAFVDLPFTALASYLPTNEVLNLIKVRIMRIV